MNRQDDREWEDGEEDIDNEIAHDSEADQLPCPSCGRMLYDDTDRCPHCGDWVMPLAAGAGGRGTWIWWTALILAVVVLVTWGVFG
ncbi:MAG: hypothetical protein V2A79_09025 [Planctomycetota bacterium]